jgi:hypothetical protein
MALFSQLPPGEQIKRWMTILTLLVVILDVIAAGSLFVVTNLMNSIVGRYEPLVIQSGEISSSVYRVHTGLYQYLGEYREDTAGIRQEVGRLRGLIGEAFKIPGAQDLGADLQEIDVTLEKYDKVLQLLPKIGTVTDWSEVDELKNQAIALGGQVEELAATMKKHAYDQISEKAARSRVVARTALLVFIAFFALSLVIVVLLLIWWRSFQEMILAL